MIDFIQNTLGMSLGFTVDFIVPFLAVLTLLVFVHEWGHYYIARRCGVRVEVFSIGFGREIFGFTDKSGTRWKFSLIPLGGYVKMYGDEDPASARVDGEKVKKMSAADKKVSFFNKTIGQRAAIVFAGPAVNFIFAILLLAGLYMAVGQPYSPPVIGGIVENGPAAQAGMLPDDRIVAINNNKVTTFQDIQRQISLNLNQPVVVAVDRAGQNLQFNIVPELVTNEDRFGFKHTSGRIGIASVSGFEVREYGLFSAFYAAGRETARITAGTLKAVGQMITGVRGTDELGGVIRIGAMAGEFANNGIIALVTFTALLSINLGLINLFPIPLLDGGHLAMYGAEALRGKPLNERAQDYLFRFGFACVLALMLFATWNDLVQLNVIEYVRNIVS